MHAIAVPDQMACLVDKTRFGDGEKVFRILKGDFLLPLETAYSLALIMSLYREDVLPVKDPDPDGLPGHMAQIALHDVMAFEHFFRIIPSDEELPFYFLCHKL